MPLKNKYLKYDPKVTKDIFSLIWKYFEKAGYNLDVGTYIIFRNWTDCPYIILCENLVCTTIGGERIANLSETTVQEILGYDPFVKEEVIPEYVECIKQLTGLEVNKIYIVKNSFVQDGKWNNYAPNGASEYFKTSTKEAYDQQNQPKPIEKWSVGSYVVIVNQVMGILLPTGTVRVINDFTGSCISIDGDYLHITRENKGHIKWFATKSEAEEFTRTIKNPIEEIIPDDYLREATPLQPKLILSINDEELPMVSIIKTNTIKQLLNND